MSVAAQDGGWNVVVPLDSMKDEKTEQKKRQGEGKGQ